MLPVLKELVVPLKDKFLNHQNYEEWRCHMTWSLISHDLWHVVRGHRLSGITLDNDSLVTRAIKLTIAHPYSLKIWQATFLSSQELWDYLRSEFGQQDSIELKFQRQEQKKVKKREKQKQRKLRKRETTISEISTFMVPVPEIHDLCSASNYLGNFLEKFPCMADPAQDSGILEKYHDGLTVQLLLDDVDHLAGFNDTSSLGTGLFEKNQMLAELLDLQAQLPDQIQQLEVSLLDEFLDLDELSSVSPTVISDYAGKELVLECIHESSFGSQSMLLDLDLQYEVIESNWFLHNDDIADLVSGDEQHTGLTHEFMAEEEEMICELPWLEIDRNSSDFQSHLSQVCTHDLPFHVNVHIPFACPHDGKVADQHLDDFSWYISYVDSEGISKQLQVTSRCLHLRNQVLLVFDTPAEGYESMVNSADSLPQQFVVGLPGQTMAEFSKAYYDHDLIDCSANSLPGQNMEQSYDTNTWFEVCYGRYTMKHFSIAGTRGTIDTFDILSAREWYRGRKIWSKIKYKDHSWLLLWLSLLYVTSTA